MASSLYEIFEQVSSSFSSLLEDDDSDDSGSDIDHEEGDSSVEELTELLGTASLKNRRVQQASGAVDRLPPLPTHRQGSESSRRGGRETTRRRSGGRAHAKKQGLARGPMPILKTRIPRDLQAVFLASQRGETVHVPPRSGTAFREFKRGKRGAKAVVFAAAAAAAPRSSTSDMPRMPKRRSCRWGSSSQASLELTPAMPRRPGRSHQVHFIFASPSSTASVETSPSLPRRCASPPPEGCCRGERSSCDNGLRRCSFQSLVAGAAASWQANRTTMTTTTAMTMTPRHAAQQPRLPQRSRSPDWSTTPRAPPGLGLST